MSPPICKSIRVPFSVKSSSEDEEDAIFVTNIYIHLVSFGKRFFWLHVSESPENNCITKRGACSMAVPMNLTPPSIASTQLLGMDASDQSSGVPEEQSLSTVQSVFASGLSERLVHRMRKDSGVDVSMTVFCAIDGERCLSLLGTEAGGALNYTLEFGGLVFRESLRLLKEGIAG